MKSQGKHDFKNTWNRLLFVIAVVHIFIFSFSLLICLLYSVIPSLIHFFPVCLLFVFSCVSSYYFPFLLVAQPEAFEQRQPIPVEQLKDYYLYKHANDDKLFSEEFKVRKCQSINQSINQSIINVSIYLVCMYVCMYVCFP